MKCMEIYTYFCGLYSKRTLNTNSRCEFVFDLQLFDGDKTEEPTGKRKSDARNKGQVAKSQELNSAFIILVAFFALKSFGGDIYDQTAGFMAHSLTNIPDEYTTEVLVELLLSVMAVLAKTALIIMMIILLMGLVVNVFQVGLLFTTQPLSPSLSKLNPISGIKRMVSMRSLVELAKSIFKIIVIGYFIIDFLKEQTMYLPKMIYADLQSSLEFLISLVFSMAFKICEVLIVMAILDYSYQLWQNKQSLKMSKQEIKDENKQSEGDPQIKSKIKQKQRQMAMQRMMQEVPKADVIITNPTHFAVALKYEKGMMAPVVVAKGQDLIAQRIKELAREAKVTIVENRPLARALYASTEIGDLVPQELYKSVAEVLAYVYRLKRKL